MIDKYNNFLIAFPNMERYGATSKTQREALMRFNASIGMLLLAIYLILVGITSLVGGIAIPAVVFGILALAAGILILIGR